MTEGDLIVFKCIGAGKTDSPPYSQDGKWRLGLFLMQINDGPFGSNFPYAKVFYRGNIFRPQLENCQLVGENETR